MDGKSGGGILLIIDGAGLNEPTRVFLAMSGLRWDLAFGGAEAFEKARAAPPDLIVIEATSRPADGVELCRRIREDERLAATPLIFVSAGETDAVGAVEALRAGADDYLEAPFDAALVSAKVTRHVERGAAARRLKEREERLRHESEMLHALMDSVPDAIYFKDTEGRFTRVNRHAPYRGGNAPDEVVGKTDFDFFVEEHARAAYEDEQRIMRTGVPLVDKEECETYTDGSQTWLSTTKVPVFDEGGRVVGIVGISRDVTARRRAEEALAGSEEKFRALIEGTTDLISVISPEGVAVYESPSCERMLGYAPEELVGRQILELVHPEDAAAVGRSLRDALGSEEMTDPISYRFRHQDGSWVALESVGKYISDPVFGGWVAVVNTRDVTEQKRLREERELLLGEVAHQRGRLDSLIANVPGVVWESWVQTDGGGQRVNFVSEQIESLLGYSREQWLSMPDFWSAIIHPDDREKALAEAGVMLAGGEARACQYRMIAKGGDVVWVETQMRPVREGGLTVGIRGITSEITGRKREEEERERLIAELRVALEEVKALRGILPICMYCKNIRNDENYWERVESYISHHTEAQFSHSICPDCYVNVVEPQFGGRKDA